MTDRGPSNASTEAIARFADMDGQRRWWRTSWCTLPEVVQGMTVPSAVTVKDDTLREGILAPGATGARHFGLEARVEFARRLVAAGIREAEVGYTVRLKETEVVMRRLKRDVPNLQLSIHTQLWGEWKTVEHGLRSMADVGADHLNLLLLTDALWSDFGACLERVREGVKLSRSLGMPVSFGTLQLLMEPKLFGMLVEAAAGEGAERIVVYDGHGCAFPAVMRHCAQFVRRIVPHVRVEVHCHNDLGLGTALVLGAVEGGADVVDVAFHGLGNRAGIGALEEVVMALEVLYRVRTGVDLQQLTALSHFVAEESGIELQAHKAVVGRNVGIHESAVHIEQILDGGGFAWEVFDPKVVGQRSQIVFGGTSLENNFRALRRFMEKNGHILGDAEVQALAGGIQSRLATQRYVPAADVLELWRSMAKQ